MQYSDGYLREVLPSNPPPAAFVPPEVDAEIRSRPDGPADENRELVARSTRWTYAMFNELRLGQFVVEDESLQGGILLRASDRVAIGLYDRETEQFGFGIAVLASGSKRPPFEQIASVWFTRLQRAFPLAVRQTAFEEHQPVFPHPVGATSAVWAKCNRTSAWGVLTAGHAVAGIQPGRAVLFSGGVTGTLLRTAYPAVDAAFVVVSRAPGGVSLMPTLRFPASGHKAVVECQSGPASRSVVSAFDSRGVINTTAFMIAFFTDKPCAGGDSGALVRSPVGEAMGIYSGSIQPPGSSTGREGFSQNFEQAAFALDVTAYR